MRSGQDFDHQVAGKGRMQVTFVMPAFYAHPIGGYRVIYEYANYLARNRIGVRIIFPHHLTSAGGAAECFLSKLWGWYKTIRHRAPVDWLDIDGSIKFHFVPVLESRYIPDGDIIIATGWETAAPVASLASRKGRQTYLVQDYELWNGVSAERVDATFRLGLQIVAVSKWLTDLAQGLSGLDVVHIPNAVDHMTFRVTRPWRERKDVLSLFHTEARKGVDTAIGAMTLVKRARPSTSFGMFGTPARPRGLPDWISYYECPQGQTLANLYNDYSIFLGASRVEGWGLPPAEAMACGCLFVGTDSKGVRDFAIDGENCLISPPDDSLALSRNVLKALSGGTRLEKLRDAGTQKIEEFTWERSGQAMLALFRAISDPYPPLRQRCADDEAPCGCS